MTNEYEYEPAPAPDPLVGLLDAVVAHDKFFDNGRLKALLSAMVDRIVAQDPLSAEELAVLRNPALLESLARGMDQAARGELVDLGSFAQYADEDPAT